MNPKSLFKWRHYQSEIILRDVRWYLSYPLSYRQVAERKNWGVALPVLSQKVKEMVG